MEKMSKKILLIEDNPEMRENTAEILELSGYEVLTAENGKEGVNKAQQHHPDLIICDVMMPELDGFGVLHMLNRNPATAGIPFIFLTAKTEMSDLRKGMNLGADDYLTKPFDDAELLDAIEMRLRKSERINADFERSAAGLDQFLVEVRSREAMQKLSENRETRLYRARDLIYVEGAYPRDLYFISSGKVKTFKTNEDAKDYITDLYKEGDFIGYSALLTDTPYPESAMALEETELRIVPKSDFFALLYDNRDVSNRFVKMLAGELNEREERLMHLAYDTVRKRVADALMTLQERYAGEKDQHFSMDVTRDTLASMVGTSKECVIRVLSDFKEEKILTTHLSNITIIDPAKLSKIRY